MSIFSFVVYSLAANPPPSYACYLDSGALLRLRGGFVCGPTYTAITYRFDPGYNTVSGYNNGSDHGSDLWPCSAGPDSGSDP